MYFQTYESALMAPDWTSHVFSGPSLPGALEPVLASWDIQVSSQMSQCQISVLQYYMTKQNVYLNAINQMPNAHYILNLTNV